MAIYHCSMKILGRTSRNTVAAAAYRAGVSLKDQKTGERFDYREKTVEHVALYLPKKSPDWGVKLQKAILHNREEGVQFLSDLHEASEKRRDAQVYREIELALPKEVSFDDRVGIVKAFSEEIAEAYGVMVLANHHDEVENPHVHMMISMRRLESKGLSAKKVVEMNALAFLKEVRERAAVHINEALVPAGFEPVSEKSFADRGIKLEPGIKLGHSNLVYQALLKEGKTPEKALELLESRDLGQFGMRSKLTYHTAAIKEFLETKVINQYKVARRPETILDLITEKKAVFCEEDIKEQLQKYIYDEALYEKTLSRLLGYKELITLGSVGAYLESSDRIVNKSDKELQQSLYTTRNMLALEKDVQERAQIMGSTVSHKVSADTVDRVLQQFNDQYKETGGLATDQKVAIEQLVERRQLSCLMGPAGSGKSTILQATKAIWETSGYRVIGLAPTNVAKENLRKDGIEAMTVHRFLGEVSKGRCLYDHKTVLMVDEAGLLDVRAFQKVLRYMDAQAVKGVFIGDTAQMQSVGAGRAFESVLRAVGKEAAQLETIMRQKEGWQRKATSDFASGNTVRALKAYLDRGCVQIVKEKLPDMDKNFYDKTYSQSQYVEIIKQYNLNNRAAGVLYTTMLSDAKAFYPNAWYPERGVPFHKNYALYKDYKARKELCGDILFNHIEKCHHLFRPLGLDPLKLVNGKLQGWGGVDTPVKGDERRNIRAGLVYLENNGISAKAPTLPPQHDLNRQTQQVLVKDWVQFYKENISKDLGQRFLVMAKTNKDVRELTEKMRAALKLQGILNGTDTELMVNLPYQDDQGRLRHDTKKIAVQIGDQVRFCQQDKGREINKGDVGTITALEKDKMEVLIGQGKDKKTVSFSTNLYKALDYGWVSTVFGAQSKTVDRSFVLASSTMSKDEVYVAMTRHRDDVKVYAPSTEFVDEASYLKYLSTSSHKYSTIDKRTELEEQLRQDRELVSFKNKAKQRLKDEFDAVRDIGKILWHQGIRGDEGTAIIPEKSTTFAPRIATRSEIREIYGRLGESPFVIKEGRQPSKKGEQKMDKVRTNQKEKGLQEFVKQERRPYYDRDQVLKTMTASDLEDTADKYFDTKYKRRTKTEVRYGRHGSVVLTISGNKFGLWKDFESGEGGDIFMLASKSTNRSYGDVITEIAENRGVKAEVGYRAQEIEKERQEREAAEATAAKKAKDTEMATKLYKASKLAKGTLVETYLVNHRGLEGDIPQDIRYVPARTDYKTGKTYPAMVSFARDQEGKIMGFQEIYLDQKTGAKAKEVEVSKKSRGTCKGSFVELRTPENTKEPRLLFLSEGVETGLSVEKVLPQGNGAVAIQAGLGRYNFRNIDVPKETTIVLCADYDGKGAKTHDFIKEDANLLREKGYDVHIIWPTKHGKEKKDFNDLLQEKGQTRAGQVILNQLPEDLKEQHIYQPIDTQKLTESDKNREETVSIKEKPFKTLSKTLEGFIVDRNLETDIDPKTSKVIADRATECLLERHDATGQDPTYGDMKIALKRAAFEHIRHEEIKQANEKQFIKDVKAGECKAKDYVSEVLLASKRQAEVEGRHFEADLCNDKTPQNDYQTQALKSMESNNKQYEPMRERLQDMYGLNDTTSKLAAYMYLVTSERQGAYLSDEREAHLCNMTQKVVESENYSENRSLTKSQKNYRRALLSREMMRTQPEEFNILVDDTFKRELREVKQTQQEISREHAPVAKESPLIERSREI